LHNEEHNKNETHAYHASSIYLTYQTIFDIILQPTWLFARKSIILLRLALLLDL